MNASDDDLYLSDDSSFYGDDDMKEELKARVSSLDVTAWWHNTLPSLTEQALVNRAKQSARDSAKLYNRYEGLVYGRQLSETVDEFLKRLPPATSKSSDIGPWIFIANPFVPYKRHEIYEAEGEDILGEGPGTDDGDNLSQLIVHGGNLLEELSCAKVMIEKEMQGQPAMKVAKAITKEKEATVAKLKKLAIEFHCTSGKWMIFCSTPEVNAIWAIIARNTATAELGTAAKVASCHVDGHDRDSRVICVYTKDFMDTDDVGRVLRKLRSLGLVGAKGTALYYKCDAYTYLDIKRDNEYGIRPWIYSSTEMLKETSMDAFTKKRN